MVSLPAADTQWLRTVVLVQLVGWSLILLHNAGGTNTTTSVMTNSLISDHVISA